MRRHRPAHRHRAFAHPLLTAFDAMGVRVL
ncbi:hypothetical protein HNQ58_001472 [Rehaibacterium terrae]|jgi:hypothetical protein|uniref:Uncharacterized protein n=1 Tax=Rehaibacterium terrae TaxID=1341696 RepID=A0A7W7Y0C0_9GAMM|nr:hypothetical protein [Rehaibacterium terrae]